MAVQNSKSSNNFLIITGPNDDKVATLQVCNETKWETSGDESDGNSLVIDETHGGPKNDSAEQSLHSHSATQPNGKETSVKKPVSTSKLIQVPH